MWVKKIELPHSCKLPSVTEAGIGSVWKCDECGKHWTIVDASAKTGAHEPMKVWAWTVAVEEEG